MVCFPISPKVVLKKRKYTDPIKDRTDYLRVTFKAKKKQKTKDTENGFIFSMLSKQETKINKYMNKDMYLIKTVYNKNTF